MVLKVGTNVVLNDDGSVAAAVLDGLAESAARLRRAGHEIVLISSGAVGLGMNRLGMESAHLPAVCAATGQSLLTALYNEAFGRHGIHTAQILVTSDDFLVETRAQGLRETIDQLLALGIVPILNENDAVSHHTMAAGARLFQDNDHLAALITELLGTKLLILLTDVEGLYDRDPAHAEAELIGELSGVTTGHVENAGGVGSRGRGGMKGKLHAIEKALRDPGLVAIIANGRRVGALDQILAGAEVGTLITAGS